LAPGRKAKAQRQGLEEIEARIGHAFANRDLLAQALTHPSALTGPDKREKSYQRLEFLGDRVLGLAVAAMLYRAMPRQDEGALSRRLSDLVRAETCADVAARLDLGAGVRVGPTESQRAVGRRAGVLADLCEAVIGAIYLDAGWDAAEAFVTRNWQDRLDADAPVQRDAKSALQEWAQGRGLATPVYRVIERTGPDHAPVFTIAVSIPGLADGIGQGAAKRQAEVAAATATLIREGVWPAPEEPT
jgi:ribonuclease-3